MDARVDNRLGFVNSLGVLKLVGLRNLVQEARSVYGLNVDIRVDDGLGFVNSFGVLELVILGNFLEKGVVVVGHCDVVWADFQELKKESIFSLFGKLKSTINTFLPSRFNPVFHK